MISYYKYGNGNLLACEDSLTAAVFDILKYLPSEIFWDILKKASVRNSLPNVAGEMLSIEYWPKWDATETNNSNYVEPDVFIRFQDFDLIIEAKRYDADMQRNYQIEAEIQSYKNEYGDENKTVYLIQLGGLNEFDLDQINSENIISKIRWMDLLLEIHKCRDKLGELNISGFKHQQLIFEDAITAMELHGFFIQPWLKDLKTSFINYKSENKILEWTKDYL
ncbi:hypothetical protein SAMN04487907_10451 [Zunongwangia mangrovi]|uniref:PD-(D/E)XK nuclease superfamily protein n=1 Tax=Zunongwangia mangrovi TaxID=1334022 RepID=A0A1I1J1H4_9FLAO|nr:hypothetical protein [Zunongwangia mangrovi]SFC39300.1 hypothetical protein SAMN04487907_10451 [Zunongwangia mangrovi]